MAQKCEPFELAGQNLRTVEVVRGKAGLMED